VSCETWSELASLGESLLMEGSPERERAQRHFERCPSCAGMAYLLDPSWALRGSERSPRLGRLEQTGFSESEISILKRDVLESGRMREVEVSVRPRRDRFHAAIAVGLLLVVAVGAALLRTGDSLTVVDSGAPGSTEATVAARRGEVLSIPADRAGLSLPVLGSVAPAAARVYDFGQEDFALVMVVHETLDL